MLRQGRALGQTGEDRLGRTDWGGLHSLEMPTQPRALPPHTTTIAAVH